MTGRRETVFPGLGLGRARTSSGALDARWSHACTAVVVSGLVALLGVGCGGRAGSGEAPSRAENEIAQAGEHDHPATSDLDRPVAALLAAKCEHGVLQYTCDECRYEVGVVKAGEELFEAARGGSLQTAVVGSRALTGARELNGEVRLNEEKAVFLGPRAPGVVHSILVDLGVRVRAGQVLYEVDSADLRAAKAAFLRSSAAAALARATVERERELFDKHVCPKKDLLEAEAAMVQSDAEQKAAQGELLALGLRQSEIDALAGAQAAGTSGVMPVRAPFAGTVLERSLSLGAQVQPGDRLLLLADTSKVWVMTAVYEREVGLAVAAQEGGTVAEVTVAAYPGRVFTGRVGQVGGTLDGATRTAHLRVVVPNPEGLLRAGMFARVRLLAAGTSEAVTLPEDAVLDDEGRAFVFVRLQAPYFIRRPVIPGRVSDGWVEVVGDVRPGDVVVTRGAFLLKSDVLRSKMGAGCAD